MTKIWVDDERPAPDGFIWAINSMVAIHDLKYAVATSAVLEEVSLDHDLGYSDELPTSKVPADAVEDNGFKVLNWMIENNVWPAVLTIHTANVPARERMLAAANAEAPKFVDIYVKTW